MDPNILAKEWELINGAPVIFGLTVAALAVGTWWLLGIRWKGRISGLEANVEALKAEVSATNKHLAYYQDIAGRLEQQNKKLAEEMEQIRRFSFTAPKKAEEHSVTASSYIAHMGKLLEEIRLVPTKPKPATWSE